MIARRMIHTLALAALVLAAVLLPSAGASADVDDFSYASWDARYEVGLDADGHATMHVTETLVAQFPDRDQNRGIVRGLNLSYEGAGTEARVLSVTDKNGIAVPYETEEDDGLLYVLTGTDAYVHGLTTYVIEYEMQNVVLAADNGVDEFYWDLLPLDSTQPIAEFSAEVVLAPPLADHLTGSTRCYAGAYGEEGTCDLRGPEDSDGSAVFRVASTDIPAGDGVTVAIGLESGTAVQPDTRGPNAATDVVPFALGGGALALSVGGWFALGAFTRSRRRATGVIVAQYEVPDSLPPLIAAALVQRTKAPVSAEIVHLAVRGALRIEEGATPEQPNLRRLPDSRIPDPLDGDALAALFQDADAEGLMPLPEASEEFSGRMSALVAAGQTAAGARGLTAKERSPIARAVQWGAITLFVIGLGLSLWGAISGRESAAPGLFVMVVAGAVVLVSTFIAFARHTVLTPEGAAAFEHLEGVREFIRVAEADRLRMLQSHSGAERYSDGGVDVVHVYERLLPYAMLFGQEKEWADVLESAYSRQQRSPQWLDGTTPYFATRLALISSATQTAATYSAPSSGSSSSAGGSFGGGFSGGGGGGGFSGGR